MTQEEIFEAIQKTLESSQKTLEAQQLANTKPKGNAVESWLERHKSIMGLVGIVGGAVGIIATCFTIYGAVRKLKTDGEARLNEDRKQLVAALDKAFDQQLGQTNSDVGVVKLMAEQMQSLGGQAVNKVQGRVASKEAAAVWERELTDLLGAYEEKYTTFEINQSAVASLRSVFDILLAKTTLQDGEEKGVREKKDQDKAYRGEGIIAPQLTAGASSFDPTVRSASLQLGSYLTSRHDDWVQMDSSRFEALKRVFGGQFLGMTTYKGGKYRSVEGSRDLGPEALLFPDYDFTKARFDGAIFTVGVSFEGATLTDCYFNKAEFKAGGVFDGAFLKSARFAGALIGSSTGKVTFKGTHIDGALFMAEKESPPPPSGQTPKASPAAVKSGATFNNVEFDGADFDAKNPPNFSTAMFRGAVIFKNTKLQGVSFDDALFYDLQFMGDPNQESTDMSGASFLRVNRVDPPPTPPTARTPDAITGAGPPGPKLAFTNVNLSNADFGHPIQSAAAASTFVPTICDLRKAIFTKCTLNRIGFSSALMSDVEIIESKGENTIFALTPGALTGIPSKIKGGQFTNGSWLVNIPTDRFQDEVGIDFSFVTESFKSIFEKGCSFTLDPARDSKSVAICIKVTGSVNEFEGILRRKGGEPGSLDAKKRIDVEAVLKELNAHTTDFGFDPLPDNKSLSETEWKTRFSEAKNGRPVIVWNLPPP